MTMRTLYAHFPMTKEPHGDIAVTLKMYRQPKLKRKIFILRLILRKKLMTSLRLKKQLKMLSKNEV